MLERDVASMVSVVKVYEKKSTVNQGSKFRRAVKVTNMCVCFAMYGCTHVCVAVQFIERRPPQIRGEKSRPCAQEAQISSLL